MEALTGPHRWGLVRVAVLFGKIIPLKVQTCLPGDVLHEPATGNLYVFKWREGENLGLDWYNESVA
jgi:hypothetical protein